MTTNPDGTGRQSSGAGWWVVGIFAIFALAGMCTTTNTNTSHSKPKVGTQACLDAQLAEAKNLPDREPYDDEELADVYANLDDLCESDRVTR